MSLHLKGGTTADLSDQGMLSTISSGFQLMTGGGKPGFSSMKSLLGGGSNTKARSPRAQPDFDDDGDEFSDGQVGDEDDEDDDELEGEGEEDLQFDETDVAMLDDENLDCDDSMLSGASHIFGRARNSMLGSLGLRQKTFICDVHNIRITNTSRRRRDVQIIMTLGAPSGQFEPGSTRRGQDQATIDASSADDPAAQAEGSDANVSSRSRGGEQRRQRSFRASRRKKVFKSDVRLPIERNTAWPPFGLTYHGALFFVFLCKGCCKTGAQQDCAPEKTVSWILDWRIR